MKESRWQLNTAQKSSSKSDALICYMKLLTRFTLSFFAFFAELQSLL